MTSSIDRVGVLLIGLEGFDIIESDRQPTNVWLKLGETSCGQVPKTHMGRK